MTLVQVATRLSLKPGEQQVTQAVSMVDANAVEVHAVKLEGGANDTVTITLQMSNDQETWFDKGSLPNLDSGDVREDFANIGYAWVRLHLELESGATNANTVAASINTAAL